VATRLYLPSTGTPAISPAFAAGWEQTGDAVRRVSRREPINSARTDSTVTNAGGATDRDVLIAQYVFGPVGAQTITGTVKGYIGAREQNADADMRSQIVMRVCSADGSTFRGTLLDFDTAALSSEFNTVAGYESRALIRGGAQSVTSVAAQEGDYVVIEIGYRAHANTTRFGGLRTGDATTGTGSGGDVPENEVSSTNSTSRGWVEFSHDFLITADDAYDEAIRDAGSGPWAYWKMEDSASPLTNRALTTNIPTEAGAPTFGGTGPFTGWGSVATDGVDDVLRARAAEGVVSYQGPGTAIGWIRTSDATQTHGEGAWVSLGGSNIEGGHTFEQRDIGSGRKWDLHALDSSLTAIDLQSAETAVTDVWRFWAATMGPNGARFLVAEPTGETLAWEDTEAETVIGQMAWEVYAFGINQGATTFGTWEISRFALYKDELTLSELQEIYDAATSTVVSPVTVAGVATVPAPTATGGSGATTVSPSTVGASATTPTPSATGAGTVSPAAVAGSATAPTPAILGGASASPSTVAATADMLAAVVAAAANVAPGTVVAVVALPAAAPDVSGAGSASPGVAAATVTVPTALPAGAALVAPGVVAAVTTVPTPSASVAVTSTPASVAAAVTVPTAAVTAGAAVAPDPVVTVVTLFTPTITGVLVPITVRSAHRFYRNPDGPHLVLLPTGRSIHRGVLDFDVVSDVVVLNTGDETTVMSELAAEWVAHAGSATATLRAAVNSRLQALGYRGVGGKDLT
jgi:hypothetical protein